MSPGPRAPVDLASDRLLLRSPACDDIDSITACCQDPSIPEWTTVPTPYRRADAEWFVLQHIPVGWADGTALTWALYPIATGDERVGSVSASAGDQAAPHNRAGAVGSTAENLQDTKANEPTAAELIGLIDLHYMREDSAEIGFWLANRSRGAGHMSEAVRLVCDYAFSSQALALRRLRWRAFVPNTSSAAVARRAGFHFDGFFALGGEQRGHLRDEWRATLNSEDPRSPADGWPAKTFA